MRNLEVRKGVRVIGAVLALGIGASACGSDSSSSLDIIDCKKGPKTNNVTFDALTPNQEITVANATIQATENGNLRLVFPSDKPNSVTSEGRLRIDTDNDNNPRFTTMGEAPHALSMDNGNGENYQLTGSPSKQPNAVRLVIAASCTK